MDTFQIPEKIQSLVYRKRKAQALWLLGRLVRDIDTGIYAEYYKDFVRFIYMYRIRLLVDWGMYRDALAYIREISMNMNSKWKSSLKSFAN